MDPNPLGAIFQRHWRGRREKDRWDLVGEIRLIPGFFGIGSGFNLVVCSNRRDGCCSQGRYIMEIEPSCGIQSNVNVDVHPS